MKYFLFIMLLSACNNSPIQSAQATADAALEKVANLENDLSDLKAKMLRDKEKECFSRKTGKILCLQALEDSK